MSIDLPQLPYAIDALEPHISARTLEFHHGKHHKAYVDKLNAAIKGTSYETQALETIIESANDAGDAGVFNNAAQIWNHTFLWHSMSPNGGGEPSSVLAEAIKAKFGSLDGFRDAFKGVARTQQERRRNSDDGQCRYAARSRDNGAADARRVGARLLPGFPEPA